MSVLVNESYANPNVPLWLPNTPEVQSSVIVPCVLPSAAIVPPINTGQVLGTFTFPNPVKWVKVYGWINIFTDASVSSETIGCNLYLSPILSSPTSNTSQITGITLSAQTGGLNNYVLLDGMTYYNSSGITSLNLMMLATTSHSQTDYMHPTSATGSVAYGASYTANPSSWTLYSGTGNILCVAG